MNSNKNIETEFEKRRNNTILIACIIKLILACIAFSLCWDCNSRESTSTKILTSLIAVVLSPFYIVYYSIYRIIMGNRCY